MNKISFLLLADSMDFATDYVAIEFEKRGHSYLRLDRDILNLSQITFDVNRCVLTINVEGVEYECTEESLKGIYYRAPTYLRETFSKAKTPEEQIHKSQWMSFFRNITCFSEAIWINNPNSTFAAENKLWQLRIAQSIGFRIPETILTNSSEALSLRSEYAIKTLDTVVLNFEDREGFVYTTRANQQELNNMELGLAPVITQEYLRNKIDLRVTVVGPEVSAVSILLNGRGVEGDWRLSKDDVQYIPETLPEDVAMKCRKIVKALGLIFSGIDLAIVNGDYYFIELNPTGEWAWLIDAASQQIDKIICDCLDGSIRMPT